MSFPCNVQDPRMRSRHNIGDLERWGSIIAGTALALYGMSRRRPSGLALAALGGLLVRRGVIGHCTVYKAFSLNTNSTDGDTRRALEDPPRQHVEEAVTLKIRP